jgi:hypothetical protein
MTGLFAIHQYVHMANDAIIGIETRYDTPINHRTIVFNDNKYTHCFTNNSRITNIVSYKADETYIIEDPTITFDIKLITTDVSHQPVIIDHMSHPHDTKDPHTTETHHSQPHAVNTHHSYRPHPHTTPIPPVIRHSIINIEQPIHVSQMSETSKTRCMEKHQEYYSRNWFSKLFYKDPCTQTDPIRAYKMVACVNTLSFSSEWADSGNVSPSGGLTMLQQCSKKCDVFPYFSVGGGHCKCGPLAPPPSLSHEDCQPCYDDKEFTCGAGLYGLNSVYEFI